MNLFTLIGELGLCCMRQVDDVFIETFDGGSCKYVWGRRG